MAKRLEDELPVLIGRRVRELRMQLGLSGRQLAAAAEVSQPFLSQLESGQTSVSLSTLYRIAHALGVTGPELLQTPVREGIEVYRRSDFTELPVADRIGSASGVGLGRVGRTINELFDFLIKPGEHIAEWFESIGEHGVICLEGCLRVEFDKGDDVTLSAGDVLFYRGPSRHRWHLESETSCRVILVGTTS
jgi:transcriptional regulator with XRE-family HTH domain